MTGATYDRAAYIVCEVCGHQLTVDSLCPPDSCEGCRAPAVCIRWFADPAEADDYSELVARRETT